MENVEDVYSLAPIQEGLVYHTISDPASGVFVDQVSCVLVGDLDLVTFKHSWALTVARHTSLRTCFLWDGLDEPLQVVREQIGIPWVQEDWSDLGPHDQNQRLTRLLHDDRRRGFDLSEAPLMRMTLARLAPQCWRWVWTFHHLISDGWSTSIILKEVFSAYGAKREGTGSPPPPFQYRDYIAWHAQQDLAQAEPFWRGELGEFSTPTRLNTIQPAPATEGAPTRQSKRSLDTSTTQALSSLAKNHRVTLNTVMQGAWGLLLSRYAHDDDVVFGVTVSGRPPQLPGIEGAVGLFINTLPLRARINPGHSLVDWLQQLQRKQFEMRQWEFSPLAAVQRWSEIPRGQPLFESILVFENYPSTGEWTGDSGLDIRELEILEQSNYPLAVLVVPGDQLELIMVYDAGEFDDSVITRMLDHLVTLLHAFAEKPSRTLGEFSLVAGVEYQKMLVAWNDTQADDPSDASIHALFERVAKDKPESTAVVCEDQQLTYRELDHRANRVAHRLRGMGVKAETCVGLYVDRGIDMIVGMLGILKAGGAYVPLDPRYPTEYLKYVVKDASLSVALTQPTLRDTAPDAGAAFAVIEDLTACPQTPQDSPPASDADRNNLAYVIYTSGSTGKPKGVMVTHHNLVHSTTARMKYYHDDVGRFLLLSSFAFDSSVAGIFWTLCTGGALVLPTRGLEQDMDRLTALIADQRVSHLLCLPALYRLILEYAPVDRLASLEVAIVAGEACPPAVAQQHLTRCPQTRLYNEYGPTEATVWSSAHRVTREDQAGPISIGRPIANTQIYLLDQHLKPVPAGVCGEIYLSGAGVARGYLNRPDLTAQWFVHVSLPLPEPVVHRMYRTGDLACYRDDGSLLFLGRADAQVKIRGYRIEIGAIEEMLAQHPDVVDAAVCLRDQPSPEPGQTMTSHTQDDLHTALSAMSPQAAMKWLTQIEGLSDTMIDEMLQHATRRPS